MNEKAIKRFEKAKKDCNLLDFDELNAMRVIKKLYADLEKDNKKTFLSLAGMAYMSASPHGSSEPTEKWVNDLLAEDDSVSLYIYLHEVTRKRDYTIEAVIAARDKAKEFRRGLSYWAKMVAHEADRIVDEATLKAYRDAGVKKVRWITEHDKRVCDHCEPRDGKVYDIDKVPPKPHINCRCWLEPT